MLLTARKILLIHFLMRLPDFVKPVVAAADRFIRTLQKDKLFVAFSATALARQGGTVRRSAPHRRYLTSQRLPRSKTKEG